MQCRKLLNKLFHNMGVFILFLYFSISIFAMLTFINYAYNIYVIDSFAGEAINSDTIYFSVNNANFVSLSEITNGEIVNNATLIQHNPGIDYNYNILYTKGKNDIFNGKFFNDWDFVSNKFVAVLGSKIKKEDIDSGIVSINQNDYKVIGRIEENIVPSINISSFYTKSSLDNVSTDGIFAIASNDKEAIEKSFNKIKKVLEDQGLGVNIVSIRNVEIGDFMNFHKELLISFFILFMLLLFASFIATLFWHISNKTWYRIMFMLGEKSLHWKINFRLIKIYAVSYIISLLVHVIIVDKIRFSWYAIFVSSAIMMLIQSLSIMIHGVGSLLFNKKNVS